ncbi:MAG: IS630 family transposase [Microcoleus vaginatus WJT46-NPBG5]|jgi:transposase|nr:IS630 family transposase [Microcoleus vaginatus WJT46-NPBG5]
MIFESEQKEIQSLKDLINSHPDSRELKRALAVKLALEGYFYRDIKQILGVSYGFISKWKARFEAQGVSGIKLAYKGSQGFLTKEQIDEIIAWLILQNHWDVSELKVYLVQQYDVAFQSNQSYYDLIKKAHLSWQKSQQVNPRKNPEIVKKRTQAIANLLETRRLEIEAGSLVVYIIDECHLLWNDICGYQWNLVKEPLKISLRNPKERQTYYGALNLRDSEFILKAYKSGNGDCTVKFVKKLLKRNKSAKLLIIWDVASYHRGQEMQRFLAQQNDGLPPNEWRVTCELLAPYAPEENPVEAIWLQLKSLLRRFYIFGKNFNIVKRLFQMFADLKLFNFPDLEKYDLFSQFI